MPRECVRQEGVSVPFILCPMPSILHSPGEAKNSVREKNNIKSSIVFI